MAPLKHCQECQKDEGELFHCSSCKKVYYCNVKCQRKHWKIHKLSCSSDPSPV